MNYASLVRLDSESSHRAKHDLFVAVINSGGVGGVAVSPFSSKSGSSFDQEEEWRYIKEEERKGGGDPHELSLACFGRLLFRDPAERVKMFESRHRSIDRVYALIDETCEMFGRVELSGPHRKNLNSTPSNDFRCFYVFYKVLLQSLHNESFDCRHYQWRRVLKFSPNLGSLKCEYTC